MNARSLAAFAMGAALITVCVTSSWAQAAGQKNSNLSQYQGGGIRGAAEEAPDGWLVSPDEAKAFKDVIARDAPRFAKTKHQLGAARAELVRQVVADPYDKNAAGQAIAAWKAAWDSFAADFSDTLVDALAQVSPEGRRKLIAGRFGRLPKE